MALPAILAYLARHGFTKAAKKYGREAVLAAGKNRRKVTKAEEKAGMGGDVPTKPRDIPRSKMPGGGRMPLNQVDKKAAQAARRAENEAAQMARGKRRIRTGAGAVVGTGGVVGGAANLLDSEQKPKPTATGIPTGEKNRSGSTPPPRVKTQKTKTPDTKVTASRKPKRPTDPKTPPKPPKSGPQRTVGAAKKEGQRTFIDKKGERKAAVTKEELEKSGLSLRDYLNRERGLTRRKDMKKGGAVKKTTKAKASKPKVRGVGIAKKGFRPAKMR
tara:strand:+ start:508 stop:1326 length:819 start_codon:yes stop_codon:yes gene_type:complete